MRCHQLHHQVQCHYHHVCYMPCEQQLFHQFESIYSSVVVSLRLSFLTRSLSAFVAAKFVTSEKTWFGGVFVILDQTVGAHSFPLFCRKPAPIQRCSQEPLCERLITFPPSNFDRMCIQHSARFVVSLPSSCLDFATSRLSRTWISCIIFGLSCLPFWGSLSVVMLSVTVSLHNLSWFLIVSGN